MDCDVTCWSSTFLILIPHLLASFINISFYHTFISARLSLIFFLLIESNWGLQYTHGVAVDENKEMDLIEYED